jgi:hypothetical protein
MSILALAFLLATACAADELKLKDGTKIVGTIVGYENDSFKVETSYGFALVRRDKVASIILSDTKKEAPVEAKKPAPAPSPPPPGVAPQSQPAAPPASPAAAKTVTAAPSPAAVANEPPKAAPSPPPPAEQAMRETLEGNSYTNHTYGFRMFKPPSWRVIEGARKLLPSALVAMGTLDEDTLLVLGRSPLRGSLDAHVTTTEKQLTQIYENYRTMGEERTMVAGLPAVQRRFRGTVDEHDWSGMLIALARGNEVFTILGITYADSDLIQIQENAIVRAVSSLEFLKQSP